MLTLDELVTAAKALPLDQRLSLIEIVTKTVREDMPRPAVEVWPLEKIYGMGRPADGLPQTDEEIKESYAEYLTEKYK